MSTRPEGFWTWIKPVYLWVTCVVFVATTTNWESMCSVCGHYYELEEHVYCLWPLLHYYELEEHVYCLWALLKKSPSHK